jgi:uncharacterized protein (TIGR00369 family)
MPDPFSLPKRTDGGRTAPAPPKPPVPPSPKPPAAKPPVVKPPVVKPPAAKAPSARPGPAIPVPPVHPVGDDVDEQRTAEAHAAMPFAAKLGVEILDASGERVRGRVQWAADLCTVANGLHGGVLMSLADTTGALLAFFNLPQGAGTSTIESKTNFLRGVSAGHVVATSTPLHVGRTTIVIVTDIHSTEGKHVARVTQTQAVISSG